MAVIWAFLMMVIFTFIYDRGSGLVVGVIVFSHWLVDLITHPMGAIFGGKPLTPDLPIGIDGTLKVGLGLYNHSFAVAIFSDLGMLVTGLLIYIFYKRSNSHLAKNC
jgi:hypothetical protein